MFDTMLRLGNLYVESYGDNEHGEANKCSIDLFQVEIVVDVDWLRTVKFIGNEKTFTRGARTHHLPICRQTRYTPDHTAVAVLP